MGIRRTLVALSFSLLMTPWVSLSAQQSYDVLELPAVPSDLAARSLVFAIHRYHDRFYAVGHRGHILYSDDGESWTQAEVPVRSTLLDIHFPTPELGWAVGHEGVILHSSDGGKTWVKQYDGLRYGEEGLAYYSKLAEAEPENEDFQFLIGEMEFAISQGADKPLFKVLFHNQNYGHALGAYGMILRTEDGGKNWVHVLHNTENDSFYHVFDFAPLPGGTRFFMSGEAGLFMIGDIDEARAELIENVPWEGSFFTSAATADGAVILGGLRGRMFRTDDEGASWEEVQKPPTSSIVESAVLDDGRLVFAGIAGELLVSSDGGRSFNFLPISSGSRIYTVAQGPEGSLLVGGPAGIKKLQLPK